MKKIFTYSRLGLLAVIALFTASCAKEKLADVLSTESFANVGISLPAKMEIGTGSNFTLTGAEITIPVTVNFSGPTTRAFTVQLSSSVDTVAQLITAGTLAPGTLPLVSSVYSIPTVLNVPIGVSSTTFNLIVSRSFLEQKYGKSIALAVKLNNPAKGNSLESGKSAAIVVIKTAEAIAAGDVHYVSFAGATNAQYALPTAGDLIGIQAKTYAFSSQGMTFNIPLSLSGVAGTAFTVDVVAFPDTVTTLINNGTLTNTVLLGAGDYSIGKVTFADNKNTAVLTINNNVNPILAQKGKKFAIGLKLTNPSRFQVAGQTEKKSIVVVFDSDYFRPYNGTPFVISGNIGQASPIIYAALYDLGGEGVAYHDDNNKDGTDFRAPDKVDVGDYNPRSVVGWTNNGEYLTYTIKVEAAGTYELNSIIGANGDNGKYKIFIDDIDISGEKFAKATPGKWGDQQPNYITVQLPAGRHIFKFLMIDPSYDVRGWIFTRKS
ncbi:hypothetical protein ACVWYN_001406 [Pedobacter sp. UYP24]